MNRIYFDNNATTPLDPKVLKAMLLDLEGPPANPSSLHSFGREAKAHLRRARETVAQFFGVLPEEVIFTSGGTESINLFLKGISGHIVTSQVEHACIYNTVGANATKLPVGLLGMPLPEDVEKALRPDTGAIALSAANHETGVRLDLEGVALLAAKHKIPLLIDAVSFIGKEPFVMYPGITAVALSAHKFHGPKGVGALILRSHQKLSSLITGGPQERNHRAGTENLAGIFGLAEALRILDQTKITNHIVALRTLFEQGLSNVVIHGEGARICNTTNVAFPHLDGETMLIQLDRLGIAASHGSACASGAVEPSRILTQMGISHAVARRSIRFSFSRMNTQEEVTQALTFIKQILPTPSPPLGR
jgi:cysteine desulfurase